MYASVKVTKATKCDFNLGLGLNSRSINILPIILRRNAPANLSGFCHEFGKWKLFIETVQQQFPTPVNDVIELFPYTILIYLYFCIYLIILVIICLYLI